jgi:hypothetical protein
MPLENAPVGSPGFGRNVATEIKAGKPQKQAVAIAYRQAGERKDAATPGRTETYRYFIPMNAGLGGHFETLKQAVAAKNRFEKQNPGREGSWKIRPNPDFRKDGTDLASGIPLNAKLDDCIRMADALYARADAMSEGRWDGERMDAESTTTSNLGGRDGRRNRF